MEQPTTTIGVILAMATLVITNGVQFMANRSSAANDAEAHEDDNELAAARDTWKRVLDLQERQGVEIADLRKQAREREATNEKRIKDMSQAHATETAALLERIGTLEKTVERMGELLVEKDKEIERLNRRII